MHPAEVYEMSLLRSMNCWDFQWICCKERLILPLSLEKEPWFLGPPGTRWHFPSCTHLKRRWGELRQGYVEVNLSLGGTEDTELEHWSDVKLKGGLGVSVVLLGRGRKWKLRLPGDECWYSDIQKIFNSVENVDQMWYWHNVIPMKLVIIVSYRCYKALCTIIEVQNN